MCRSSHVRRLQAKVREQLGAQVTAFDSVVDGQQTLHSGDVLRLATKPVLVGRALHFIVGEVSCDITLPPLQFAQPVSTPVWLPRIWQ